MVQFFISLYKLLVLGSILSIALCLLGRVAQ
jgi:hypothetical protein